MNLTEDMVRAAMERARQVANTPEVCWYVCDATTPQGKVLLLQAGGNEWYVIHPDDFAEIERETAGIVQWQHVREQLRETPEPRP